ncbi:hypothetical protein BB560_007285 [Smittium megazygosporum]|uniref:Uncharacterized protein n=1 Tax=Smittium megazygosporum TaxID=133381 RepID=A0A2T9XXC2_9FUNG|nr:hypothetical protein BB560_007285 [Smittium megazygosporum]
MSEGLPPKFKGEDHEIPGLPNWIRTFKLVSALKKWDEATKLMVLEVWLENKTQSILSESPTLLAKEFDNPEERKGGIIKLYKLEKEEDEILESFCYRFERYCETIPKGFLTPEIKKDAFLLALYIIDHEIYFRTITNIETKTAKQAIEAERYSLIS